MKHGRIFSIWAVALLLLLGASSLVLAIDELGLFELDGNAVNDPLTPGDDWDTVLLGGGGQSLVSSGLITDAPSAADDNFTSGGSKDINDISAWQWTINSVPNKDDILHAFAAIYRNPANGHFIIYFGADRFANNGDSQIGFWFFRNKVGKKADGTFSGVHAVGDLLVLTDFTQGGSLPGISVYEWVGSGGSDGSLNVVATGVDCATSPGGDLVCGRVNSSNQPSPWPFQSTGPHDPPNTFLPGEFFEAGLDLTALLPNVACLSSFLAETRSAQQLTAQLEDFALGSFDTCKIDVQKSGPSISKAGDPALYTYTITNKSIATLYLQSIVDVPGGDLTAVAAAGGCSTLAPGASCTFQKSYVVQPGDPDPLVNTVTVIYNDKQDLTGIQISGSATFSVNLFQPSVSVSKSGPSLAQAGDNVTYTFTITNTSSNDSPNLVLDSVSDNILGSLAADAAAAGCTSLAPGASCTFNKSRVVQPGDPNPLVNTVTVHYHPQGFPNDITAQASHSLAIYTPSVAVVKNGPALSKIGDPASYTFTITNTSSANSPALMLDSVTDSVLGSLTAAAEAAGCSTLAAGASCTFSATYTVKAGDPDPLINTVTVHSHPMGAANDISAQASHTTNLFQPSVSVSKSGPTLGKVGDTVTYSFTITNTSSNDSPNLVLDSVSDTVLGSLTSTATGSGCTSLAPGASCTFTKDYTIQPGDPDPLVNVVTVHYHPLGFPNDITASASHSLNLFAPSVAVVKTGPALSKVGDPAVFNFTITNTSSPDSPPLVLDTIVDNVIGNLAANAAAAGCTTLAPGASCTFPKTYTVKAGDPDPLVNTVTVHYHPLGFVSDVTASSSHTTNLFQPSVSITKSGPTLGEVGETVTYTFTVTNTSSADSPSLVLDSVTDTVLGSLMANATGAGCTTLAPGGTCTFTQTYTIKPTDPDPLLNTVTVHYHPQGFPNDITASATHSLNLFNPALSVVKNGPALDKAGDTAVFTFTITNTGSPDSPPLVMDSVVDNVIGDLTAAALGNGCSPLAPGASCTFSAPYTIKPTDPDPLVNTVTVHAHSQGFTDSLTASGTHITNLFQPSVSVSKACDPYAVPGFSNVTYTFTITNTSSPDSPPLVLANVTDSLLGDLTGLASASCATLAPGASCTFTAARLALATDPNPLVNTVSVLFHPAGFPNNITASTSCSTTLIHPAGEISKTCLTNPVPIGASANFRINVANVGDVPLITHLTDPTTGLDTTFSLGVNPTPPCSDLVNDPANGCYMTEIGIIATGTTVFNSAHVDNTLPPQYGIVGIVYSNDASAECTVTQGGATRTQGFWATHCDYTQHVFNVHLSGTMNIGWKVLDGSDDVFGIFWANNAKNSNGTKRSQLCAAKETTANQVVAAILNSALSNGAPLPVPLATIQAIMSGTNITAIRNLGTTLDTYNQSGDTQAIVDNDGTLIKPADPKCAKALADIPFADCP